MLLAYISPLAFAATPPLLAAVSAFLILKADQSKVSYLDAEDPAGWQRSQEWLIGAPIAKELSHAHCNNAVVVACHPYSGDFGRSWRTLRRYDSVQSVTLYDDSMNKAIHSTAGNEYLKVMAAAYASLVPQKKESRLDGEKKSILYLGLGGGTLPMLVNEPCDVIELDPDVVDMATKYCDVDCSFVNIHSGVDALNHSSVTPGPHSCVFVDVFGIDNNVPSGFVTQHFVQGIYDNLEENGVVLSNFHYGGNDAEEKRLQEGKVAYSNVFGSCLAIPSRFQRNMILCAKKEKTKNESSFDLELALMIAKQKGWLFDPTVRLQGWKRIKAKQNRLFPM